MAITWEDIKLFIQWTQAKEIYIYISSTLLVFLITTIIYDFVHITITERTDLTTQKFTTALLVSGQHTDYSYASIAVNDALFDRMHA